MTLEKRKFPVYLPEKPVLPQFLDESKDICSSIQQYAQENLNKLSIEFMSEYLHDAIIPKMIKEEYRLEPTEWREDHQAVKKFNLTCISPATIARWLEKLRFKYQQKSILCRWAWKTSNYWIPEGLCSVISDIWMMSSLLDANHNRRARS